MANVQVRTYGTISIVNKIHITFFIIRIAIPHSVNLIAPSRGP
jgi:hypothetical protein